jgi:hypothetical protein
MNQSYVIGIDLKEKKLANHENAYREAHEIMS